MQHKPTNRRGALLAIAALALGPSAASAETEHPLIGTWEGTWPNGLVIELTVTAIEGNNAHGIYCNVPDSGSALFVWDIGPDHIPAKLNSKGRLKYKIGKTRWEFRPDKSDPDAMRMIHRRDGSKNTLDVERINIEDATCRSRVSSLPTPNAE